MGGARREAETGEGAEYDAEYEIPLDIGAMRYRFPRAAALWARGRASMPAPGGTGAALRD